MRLVDADELKESQYYSYETHSNVVPVLAIDCMPTIQVESDGVDEVLQDIKHYLEEWYHIPNTSLSWNNYTILCDLINKHLSNKTVEEEK